MFDSFAQIFPAQWQGAVLLLLAPLRSLAQVQSTIVDAILGSHPAGRLLLWLVLLIPALVIAAGMWCTALSLYTIPFRSGRVTFVTAFLMTWCDAGRCIWLFWTGMLRVGVALVGWIIGSLRFGLLMVKNILLGIVRSPLTLLDGASRSYFQPGVPWVAFMLLTLWCAIEATVFTFTLQPTLVEVFGSLTGFDPNPAVMAPLLWMFLFLLVAGSFACVQVVTEAVKAKKTGTIIQMLVVESAVMFFEVIFLYRELIDAITPWIAQQSGGVRLGLVSTLLLASFGWAGVRGMSWFLFGRFGTPALLAILSRQTISQDSGVSSVPAPVSNDMWRAPIDALKKDVAWFHQEGKRLFELLTLPVLQLLAAALNFAVVVVQSRPAFALPFKTLDEMLRSNPFSATARSGRIERGLATPRDPMPRVAS